MHLCGLNITMKLHWIVKVMKNYEPVWIQSACVCLRLTFHQNDVTATQYTISPEDKNQ